MTNKETITREKAIKILQTVHLGKSWLVKDACDMAIKALEEQKTGTTIPDNATNGDMIKIMFPHYDIEVDEYKGYVRIFYSDFYTTYPFDWWNAPYKREEK